MAWEQGNVVIMSDFNDPDVDWAIKACHFLNVLQGNFMKQKLEDPARKNSILLGSKNTELNTVVH